LPSFSSFLPIFTKKKVIEGAVQLESLVQTHESDAQSHCCFLPTPMTLS
jgi:hypothetical protein